jgi:hypothetical protein
MVPSWAASAHAVDQDWLSVSTFHRCLLLRVLRVKVKPMAQHSQPMRLLGRRARIIAPTVAKARKGSQVASAPIHSRAESAS